MRLLALRKCFYLCSFSVIFHLMVVSSGFAQLGEAYEAAYPAVMDPFMGNWEGAWVEDEDNDPLMAAQVVPLGDDRYRITLTNLLDVRARPHFVTEVTAQGGTLRFDDGALFGEIAEGAFTGGRKDSTARYRLVRVERASETLGARAPRGAVVLFDGSDLSAWRETPGWVVTPRGTLVVTPGSADLHTVERFADVRLHVEFRLPYRPALRGQDRGNSGVYLQNNYELQILDSFGLEGLYDECGAIYKLAAPRVNACRPPLQWQTYDIEYTAPRFGADGEIASYGRMTVHHNGVLIHHEQELLWRTSGGKDKRNRPHPRQPASIKIQEHEDFVEFRNIWLVDTREGGH